MTQGVQARSNSPSGSDPDYDRFVGAFRNFNELYNMYKYSPLSSISLRDSEKCLRVLGKIFSRAYNCDYANTQEGESQLIRMVRSLEVVERTVECIKAAFDKANMTRLRNMR